MIIVKLTNVSIKSGDKFRNNQNYTMTIDKIDENSSIVDIKQVIESKYANKIILNNQSKITIL